MLIDAVVTTSAGATGPEYLYDFNTDTDTWTELDGPNVASQLTPGMRWISATVDAADNAYLLYGYNPGSDVDDPEIISVNRATGAVQILFSPQINPAPNLRSARGLRLTGGAVRLRN